MKLLVQYHLDISTSFDSIMVGLQQQIPTVKFWIIIKKNVQNQQWLRVFGSLLANNSKKYKKFLVLQFLLAIMSFVVEVLSATIVASISYFFYCCDTTASEIFKRKHLICLMISEGQRPKWQSKSLVVKTDMNLHLDRAEDSTLGIVSIF